MDFDRKITAGSPQALHDAIRRGADLRIYTEFRHNEHIDPSSDNPEMIREVSDFPATYLIDDRWVAAMMTLRQPVTLPGTFGRPSMSFFMYNEDGRQAVARPYLDGNGPDLTPYAGPGCDETKWHELGMFDMDTNAPSNNFIYDFYSYKFIVDDCWEEVLSHDAEGNIISGNPKLLDEASNEGRELKVGIRNVCEGMRKEAGVPEHELFIATGPHYYYSETGYMICETRPFVRVEPSIPMTYESRNWDFGWAIVRSDGQVATLYYDPYTLKPVKSMERHAMRWFVHK